MVNCLGWLADLEYTRALLEIDAPNVLRPTDGFEVFTKP